MSVLSGGASAAALTSKLTTATAAVRTPLFPLPLSRRPPISTTDRIHGHDHGPPPAANTPGLGRCPPQLATLFRFLRQPLLLYLLSLLVRCPAADADAGEHDKGHRAYYDGDEASPEPVRRAKPGGV